jgi:tol-pal system protein YbgF
MRLLAALIFPVAAWAAEAAPSQQPAPNNQAAPSHQAVPTPQAGPSQPQVQQAPVDIETRVGKLETLMQSQAVLNLLKEVEALRAEVSRLRGQTDMQAHQLESLSKRQSDLYVDLDKRVEDLNKLAKSAAQPVLPPAPSVAVSAASQTPAAVAPQASGSAAKEDPLAESKAYEAALNQFKAGDYEKAIAGFAAFLKAYPDSTLAANAQYWTGYAYYARKDYKNSLAQQMKLVSAYPQSPKVPDALLNIANNQVELKDLASAKKNLEEIVAKYPGTNAAAIAIKRLNLLK